MPAALLRSASASVMDMPVTTVWVIGALMNSSSSSVIGRDTSCPVRPDARSSAPSPAPAHLLEPSSQTAYCTYWRPRYAYRREPSVQLNRMPWVMVWPARCSA